MEASSMMLSRNIARHNMPPGVWFHDASMKMLAEYFGITNINNLTSNAERRIAPTLLQNLLDNPATGVEEKEADNAPVFLDRASQMPVRVLDNKDLYNTADMNLMDDSSEEEDIVRVAQHCIN
ncbi:hypothetical protein QFC21_000708 [Naganishia friedmannii]|uniref:Uncharacterized protein n=1 Tax=Naganishia friedmannii TaxID=89922 RepID=A0ACC2W830_9TREE|nr:hypothetical protein QFC21_000708 [Naganishia friedmannii]